MKFLQVVEAFFPVYTFSETGLDWSFKNNRDANMRLVEFSDIY